METQLIGCSANNVSLHLKNIYQDKELSEEATTEDFSVVQQEGQREVQRIDSDFDKILRGKR